MKGAHQQIHRDSGSLQKDLKEQNGPQTNKQIRPSPEQGLTTLLIPLISQIHQELAYLSLEHTGFTTPYVSIKPHQICSTKDS